MKMTPILGVGGVNTQLLSEFNTLILFSAIFYGFAIIWECDLGIVHNLLVTPAPRTALVLGKAVAADLRGLVQAAVVWVLLQ